MSIIDEQRENIVKLIYLYKKNENINVILTQLENYLEKNNLNLNLKELNNTNFDILLCILNNNENIQKYVSNKYIPNKDTYDFVKLINFIIYHGKYEMLNYSFLNYVPLFSAVANGNFKIANLLIENGADINYILNTKDSFNINIINYCRHIFNKNCFELSKKILKFILNKNFNGKAITTDFLNKIISKNQYLLDTIFEHYIFDNEFILNLLSIYKNKTRLSNENLKKIINEEKNKIIIHDSMYDTSMKWGCCHAAKILLDYDSHDYLEILTIIEKYNMLEKVIIFNNYELAKKILSFKDLNFQHYDIQKLLINLCRFPKGGKIFKLLVNTLLNHPSFNINTIKFNDLIKESITYRNLNTLKFLLLKVVLNLNITSKEDEEGETETETETEDKRNDIFDTINVDEININNLNYKNTSDINLLLCIAIELGSLKLVKFLLENEVIKSKIDINFKEQNEQNEYPIIISLYSSSVVHDHLNRQIACEEIFKYLLLVNGINLNIKDNLGNSLFSLVIHQRNYKMTKYYLQQNFYIDENDGDKNYSPSLIKAIYDNKINIERDSYSNNILYYAIHKEDIKLIKILINLGIDLDFGRYCNSAIFIAIKIGNKDIFNEILKSKNLILNEINNQLESPFSVIIKSRDFSLEDKMIMIKNLIQRGYNITMKDGYGKSILIDAIQEKSLPLIQLLIENGVNINDCCDDRKTPLAAAIQIKSLPIVKYLVENGALVNEFVNDTNTMMRYDKDIPLLMYAIDIGDIDIIKYLIENKATFNFKNNYEYYKLIDIINKKEFKFELIDYIKKYNLDLTLFHIDILKLLICEERIDLLKMLIPRYVNINIKDEYGNTLLANAIIASNHKLVYFFIKNGADLHSINFKNEIINDLNKIYNYKYNKNNYDKINKILLLTQKQSN
ncbi:ankyrin [Anaeromyces robustus]|uniref:Ankyrin n=1 Tax=Anaeromyces robustus TaxID=1754192 RepID=A0A1Y1X3R1_9FUNG|nr:ankyrin [Anaeromyces robustus]|eukprot:ORX80447.1 ankyrin [Anaeromyces robustus]